MEEIRLLKNWVMEKIRLFWKISTPVRCIPSLGFISMAYSCPSMNFSSIHFENADRPIYHLKSCDYPVIKHPEIFWISKSRDNFEMSRDGAIFNFKMPLSWNLFEILPNLSFLTHFFVKKAQFFQIFGTFGAKLEYMRDPLFFQDPPPATDIYI